jgi:hypothetical protein
MLNSNKFTFVNVCFQYERNDDSGLYGQTLNSRSLDDLFVANIIGY